MENQEQVINQLKAEVYDLSKQLQQVTSLLGQIAKLVEAETVEDVLSKITAAFAPKATKSSASIPAPGWTIASMIASACSGIATSYRIASALAC